MCSLALVFDLFSAKRKRHTLAKIRKSRWILWRKYHHRNGNNNNNNKIWCVVNGEGGGGRENEWEQLAKKEKPRMNFIDELVTRSLCVQIFCCLNQSHLKKYTTWHNQFKIISKQFLWYGDGLAMLLHSHKKCVYLLCFSLLVVQNGCRNWKTSPIHFIDKAFSKTTIIYMNVYVSLAACIIYKFITLFGVVRFWMKRFPFVLLAGHIREKASLKFIYSQ